MLIDAAPADESGDDRPALGAASDSGAFERHPADAFLGYRLLLRSATGVDALSRGQPSQHAERRMGIAILTISIQNNINNQ